MKPEGLRKVKIPRAWWKAGVQKEARMLGIRRWWVTAMKLRRVEEILKEAKIL